jgi:hypothetical protein
MLTSPRILTEKDKAIHILHQIDSIESSFIKPREEIAFIERLPLALSYAADLDLGDHAVLFYDNLVVAAEYFSAFIDGGINRQEATCFIGLSRERYEKLFEQIGVKVAQLENCGYLRHFSSEGFHMEDERPNKNKALRKINALLSTTMKSECHGMRFIYVHDSSLEQNASINDVIEFEQCLNEISTYPVSTMCCYNARMVLLSETHSLFTQLMETHGDCLFQGIAMPTITLLRSQINPVSPKLKSS